MPASWRRLHPDLIVLAQGHWCGARRCGDPRRARGDPSPAPAGRPSDPTPQLASGSGRRTCGGLERQFQGDVAEFIGIGGPSRWSAGCAPARCLPRVGEPSRPTSAQALRVVPSGRIHPECAEAAAAGPFPAISAVPGLGDLRSRQIAVAPWFPSGSGTRLRKNRSSMLNREPVPSRPGISRRPARTILLIVALVVIFGLSGAATLWTDYLWYGSMELSSVWEINLVTSVALVVVAAVIAFAMLWLNLIVANRLCAPVAHPDRGRRTGHPLPRVDGATRRPGPAHRLAGLRAAHGGERRRWRTRSAVPARRPLG